MSIERMDRVILPNDIIFIYENETTTAQLVGNMILITIFSEKHNTV